MPHQHSQRDPECLAIFARLSEYIDGELDSPTCAEVEAHMADCPPCIEFLRSLRASARSPRLLDNQPAPAPLPPAFENKLKDAWTAALARRRSAV